MSETTQDEGEIDGGTVREVARQSPHVSSAEQRPKPSQARPPWQRSDWQPYIPRPSLYAPSAEKRPAPQAHQRSAAPPQKAIPHYGSPRGASPYVAACVAAALLGAGWTSPARQFLGGLVHPVHGAPASAAPRLGALVHAKGMDAPSLAGIRVDEETDSRVLVMGGRGLFELLGPAPAERHWLRVPGFSPYGFAVPQRGSVLLAVGHPNRRGPMPSAGDSTAVLTVSLRARRPVGSVMLAHSNSGNSSFAVSPDGGTVAGACWAEYEGGDFIGGVGLWDARTGRLLRVLSRGGWCSSGVDRIAFSPDGHWLAWGAGAQISLWDRRTDAALSWDTRDDPGWNQYGLGNALTFSPDSRTLATAGARGTVALWDVVARRRMGRLAQPEDGQRVKSLAFSPDGGRLALWRGARTVTIWDVQTDAAKHLALQDADTDWCALAYLRR